MIPEGLGRVKILGGRADNVVDWEQNCKLAAATRLTKRVPYKRLRTKRLPSANFTRHDIKPHPMCVPMF